MPYHLIANIITSISIFCGILSIFSSINGQINQAAWLIILAIIMDILDGKVARLLMPADDFGKEFDSLADLISFGVAPLVLLEVAFNIPKSFIWVVLFFFYILCAALRLARFNIQKARNRYSCFIGLPTTAAAGFITASILLLNAMATSNPLYIKLGILLLGILMVSVIPYPNAINIHRFIWILISAVLLILFIKNRALCLWLIFCGYIVIGPLFVLGRKQSKEFLPG